MGGHKVAGGRLHHHRREQRRSLCSRQWRHSAAMQRHIRVTALRCTAPPSPRALISSLRWRGRRGQGDGPKQTVRRHNIHKPQAVSAARIAACFTTTRDQRTRSASRPFTTRPRGSSYCDGHLPHPSTAGRHAPHQPHTGSQARTDTPAPVTAWWPARPSPAPHRGNML